MSRPRVNSRERQGDLKKAPRLGQPRRQQLAMGSLEGHVTDYSKY